MGAIHRSRCPTKCRFKRFKNLWKWEVRLRTGVRPKVGTPCVGQWMRTASSESL